MYWTTGAYSITVNGNPQFQDANPAAGIPNGTVFNAAWANMLTNEVMNVVLAAGLVPSQTDETQLTEAIRALVPNAAAFFDFSRSQITSNETIDPAAEETRVTCANSVPITLTLGPGTTPGQGVTILGSPGASVTVASSVSTGSPDFELPDGSSVYSISIAAGGGAAARLVWDGTNWRARVVGSPSNQVAITNSGLYTPSAGILYAIVEVQGGGGAQSGRNGGGAGTYFRGVLTAAQIGASQSVTIGAGGASGGNGGATSFGTLISCPGGRGNSAGNAGAATLAAGVSGFTMIGTTGSPGTDGSSSYPRNGIGASSYFGGGTLYVGTAAPGAGGDPGGPGICIVTEFFA